MGVENSSEGEKSFFESSISFSRHFVSDVPPFGRHSPATQHEEVVVGVLTRRKEVVRVPEGGWSASVLTQGNESAVRLGVPQIEGAGFDFFGVSKEGDDAPIAFFGVPNADGAVLTRFGVPHSGDSFLVCLRKSHTDSAASLACSKGFR